MAKTRNLRSVNTRSAARNAGGIEVTGNQIVWTMPIMTFLQLHAFVTYFNGLDLGDLSVDDLIKGYSAAS